ncbi:MAG: DeoR/GlpR family DNA-binding transcription regulator [Synergistaceae bacterium]|nr:DeoR/GlpR family DNA-binding transcription regulator [Synergistaceae bacterium]
MLAEERFSEILKILGERKTVTVQDFSKLLRTSESTIRRDLAALHSAGRVKKLHGGASLPDIAAVTVDDMIEVRSKRNWEEKGRIAKYASSLIKPEDFVFIDAGTSTAMFVEQIIPNGADFVTNAIFHAKTLAQKGCRVYLLGGMFKPVTEAVIGSSALNDIAKYNFTVGFFGTNGITHKNGYSTPDSAEAMLKGQAMRQCKEAYVLADPSKFNVISSVSFAAFNEATVITTAIEKAEYMKDSNIVEADKE